MSPLSIICSTMALASIEENPIRSKIDLSMEGDVYFPAISIIGLTIVSDNCQNLDFNSSSVKFFKWLLLWLKSSFLSTVSPPDFFHYLYKSAFIKFCFFPQKFKFYVFDFSFANPLQRIFYI